MSALSLNLLAATPAELAAEEIQTLLSVDGVRIERIVSSGQASPPDFWYEQEEHEWVLLLQGRGLIEFADGDLIDMQPGAGLFIPAGVRHRVQETSQSEPTIWLVFFWNPSGPQNRPG